MQLSVTLLNVSEVNRERSRLAVASSVCDSTKHNGLVTVTIFFFLSRKPEVHHKAVNMVRNLLTSHDFDSRFLETSLRCRVANLYLPLIAIIIDNLPKLFAWTAEGEVRIVGNANQNEHLNLILNVISDNLPNVSQKVFFQLELRNL